MSEIKIIFDLVQKHSLALWRHAQFEPFLTCFASILREQFGAREFEVFDVTVSKGYEFKDFFAEGARRWELARFSKNRWNQTEKILKTMSLKDFGFRAGYNEITVQNESVYFVLVGDPASTWRVFAWVETYDSVAKESQLKMFGSEELRRSVLDFLCKQVQSEALWFNRVDKTEALLHRDDLTGLFNAKYLELALENEVRRSQRFQSSFCLFFIDLDHFKPINDQFGHMSGSMVLKQVADVLRDVLREVDSIVRYGGDEFVVLLLGTTATTGFLAAERLRKKIESTYFRVETGETVQLTACVGVSVFPDHGLTGEEMLRVADKNMYRAKHLGKNKVVMDDARGSLTMIDQRALGSDLWDSKK